MDNSELTIKAREIARTLTYNDDTNQAEAKHMLLELAHRLDIISIRVHQKRDGMLVINGLGKCRYMSLREAIFYRIFGIVPRTG